MNIADALDRNNLFFSEREAIIYEGSSLSYGQLWRLVDKAAAGLAEVGVTHGDRVCLFLTNCPEFIVAYYACQKLGAICVSLSSMCKSGEVEYMLNDCAGKVLVTEGSLESEVPGRSATPNLETVVSLDSGFGDMRWEALLAKGSGTVATVYTDRHDGAAIIYTSGTTGVPKGVVLTHGNVVSNTNATKHMCDMRGDDRAICFLPIYHSFAQNFIFNSVIQAGCTLVLHKKFEPEPILESLRTNRVTRWYAVPPIYIMLLDNPNTDEAMKTVRYCFSAAASMPGEVARKWKERFGHDINEGYGLTETTPFATYNHEFRHKEGSVGTAIMDVDIMIADETTGEPMPMGEPGEIRIKGPNVMKEYFGKPDETDEAVKDGWLCSGDIGYMDEEGYVFIVDRVKDMINSAGLKVWPREVEEVLYTHPDVKECAVIGVPHEVFGETVKAVVALHEGAAEDGEALIELVRSKLADYKAPKIVEFIPELPKNPTGKILKRELRAD